MSESICKSCGNAESNGGNCREFQASDGHYTWRTPIFQGDDETERLCHEQGGSFNSEIASCGHFTQKQCKFAEQGAYELDCSSDRPFARSIAGAYFAVCGDPSKSLEVA